MGHYEVLLETKENPERAEYTMSFETTDADDVYQLWSPLIRMNRYCYKVVNRIRPFQESNLKWQSASLLTLVESI
jgi:hypothetical protein